MLAILEDAVASFQEYCAAKHGKRKQLFNDVEKWFFAASSGWIFDFESICSIVGFDPDYFRRGLLHWRENELSKSCSAPLEAQRKRQSPNIPRRNRVTSDVIKNDSAGRLMEVNGNEYQVL